MITPSESIILQREFDGPNRVRWIATYQGYDGPESPIGTGATPTDAVEALLEISGDGR